MFQILAGNCVFSCAQVFPGVPSQASGETVFLSLERVVPFLIGCMNPPPLPFVMPINRITVNSGTHNLQTLLESGAEQSSLELSSIHQLSIPLVPPLQATAGFRTQRT